MAVSAERRTQDWGGMTRLRFLRVILLISACVIIARLISLQIFEAKTYNALAETQHELYETLVPRRGSVYVTDRGDDTWYPVATVAPRAFVYADPRKVTDPVVLGLTLARIIGLEGLEEYERLDTLRKLRESGQYEAAQAIEDLLTEEARDLFLIEQAEELAKNPPPPPEIDPVTGEEIAPEASALPEMPSLDLEALWNTNEIARLITRLAKTDDPYEPVARNVSQEKIELIEALNEPALAYIFEDARSYPEIGFGGQVIGFLGKDAEDNPRGYYGLEGYFEDFLAGVPGSLAFRKDVSGRFIGVGDSDFTPAIDGGDLLLTIDRTVQVVACGMLRNKVEEFEADSGALVILAPETGAVIAMCNWPDFASSDYGNVDDARVYNNDVIFTPYEPGSIFKPLVLAAALDVGVITPETTFTDPGSVEIDDFTIRNADEKVYGTVSMIQVLEDSINTGMIWIMRKMGRDTMRDAIERFGFGEITGIELNTEAAGTIASLWKSSEVYPATASFGQGITTTPMQMAAAYAALANDGVLMQPYIVAQKKYPDGTIEETRPRELRQVVSKDTAAKIGGMMVSVVEYGHGQKAAVPGYYIAGKTGTAQIARNGVYSKNEFNGSFAGYGPIEDPAFAMVVKIENPKNGVIYAESTAAPLFGEIAEFLLSYYNVPPNRTE